MIGRLFNYLVRLKPTAYISDMSVRILFFLYVCFFGKLRLLPFVVDTGMIFAVGVSRDGSGGTSDWIVTFLLYFFTASRIAVLMI